MLCHREDSAIQRNARQKRAFPDILALAYADSTGSGALPRLRHVEAHRPASSMSM